MHGFSMRAMAGHVAAGSGPVLLVMLCLVGFSGCQATPESQDQMSGHESMDMTAAVTDAPEVTRAVCVLYGTAGNDVSGLVEFTLTGTGMRVRAEVQGLAPGDHGFHIHDFGDCSAPDATSAGGHFNPGQVAHAGPDAMPHHIGDLGNITADSTGRAVYERVDPELVFTGPTSILGRGVIVHAQADDLVSQPTGAAGARVACGTIGVAAAP